MPMVWEPCFGALMMSSQLGRAILGGSASTTDEMTGTPDQDGRYGPLDELLDEIAANARSGSEVGNDQRRGPQSTDTAVG